MKKAVPLAALILVFAASVSAAGLIGYRLGGKRSKAAVQDDRIRGAPMADAPDDAVLKALRAGVPDAMPAGPEDRLAYALGRLLDPASGIEARAEGVTLLMAKGFAFFPDEEIESLIEALQGDDASARLDAAVRLYEADGRARRLLDGVLADRDALADWIASRPGPEPEGERLHHDEIEESLPPPDCDGLSCPPR